MRRDNGGGARPNDGTQALMQPTGPKDRAPLVYDYVEKLYCPINDHYTLNGFICEYSLLSDIPNISGVTLCTWMRLIDISEFNHTVHLKEVISEKNKD